MCALQTNQSCSTPLKLILRLRGGVGSDAESQSQTYGDDDYEATQAYGDDDEEEEMHLVNMVGGQAAGVAATLPNGTLDILAVGRADQPVQRASTTGAEPLVVTTLLLIDSESEIQQVSRLHAEIARMGDVITLQTTGQSYSFVNENPLHATSVKYPKSMQLYDGDLLRFGGGLTGKKGGGFSKFVYRVDAPPLGKRPSTAAAAPSALPPTAPTAAPRPMPTVAAKLVAAAGDTINIDNKPKARTELPGGTGFVTATRDGHFDLHALLDSVAYSQGAAGSWVTLPIGGQRRLHSGDRITLSAVEYTCTAPNPDTKPTPAVLLPTGTTVEHTQQGGSASAAAIELSALTTRHAGITAAIVSGLSGKARSEAVRTLGAASAALHGVVLATVAGSDPEQTARTAAIQLSKVANDYGKKRRRESKTAESSAAKAQRRESHTLPRIATGRAPGGAKAKRDRHDDQRTFNNRSVQRKARRVDEDERREVRITHGGG